jgi:hypothetical protein
MTAQVERALPMASHKRGHEFPPGKPAALRIAEEIAVAGTMHAS